MDCPACKGVVVVVEYERIEVDYCTDCFGVWFDAGELELLLERLSLDGAAFTMQELLALPDAKVAEKVRPCPICRKKMRKVHVGSGPEVLVDVCPVGHGVWFDGGELNQVIRQLAASGTGTASEQGRVITFLGEVFKARE